MMEVHRQVLEELRLYKIHHRESNSDVLSRMIRTVQDSDTKIGMLKLGDVVEPSPIEVPSDVRKEC